MVLENFREEFEKVFEAWKNSAVNCKECAVDYLTGTFESGAEEIKDSVRIAYQNSNEILLDSWKNAREVLQLDEAWKYRNNYIAEYSLANRINTTIAMNIPIFLFSSGFRRLRNPIVFTAFASVLILPELVNPFNRR